jgi:cell division protein FtsQ
MPKKKSIKSFNLNIGAKLNKLKVVLLLIIILIIVSYLVLSYAPIFNVKTIEVNNNSKITDERIIELSGITKEINLLKINKNQVIINLKKEPYIEDVSIKRKFPTTVELDIKERVPAFLLQIAESYVYVDIQGYMLEISTEKNELPVVTGLTTDLSNVKAGDRLNKEDSDKLNRIIQIINIAKSKEVYHLITKIDVSNLNNCSVGLETEGKTAFLGDCSELDIRMDYMKTIIDQEVGHTGLIFINADLSTGKAFFREE